MKSKLIAIWYYIECYFTIIQIKFGYRKDTSVIPTGVYCYTADDEKNSKEESCKFWIKLCPYYRSINKEKQLTGCTYTGFSGWDMCHWDQCKLCNIHN